MPLAPSGLCEGELIRVFLIAGAGLESIEHHKKKIKTVSGSAGPCAAILCKASL